MFVLLSALTMNDACVFFFKSQASRPEQSVMQALESLTETQVSVTCVFYVVVDICAILNGRILGGILHLCA